MFYSLFVGFLKPMVVSFLFLFGAQSTLAATFSALNIDRSSSIVSGTGVLSSTTGGISVASFGPTVTDTVSSALLFPSISLASDGTGSVSFSGLGFPPSVALGGTVQDFRSSASLIEVLFKDASSSELFVADISSVFITGAGLSLNAPFFDPATGISVFSATDTSVAPIPLPATGWFFVSVLLSVGYLMQRARRA